MGTAPMMLFGFIAVAGIVQDRTGRDGGGPTGVGGGWGARAMIGGKPSERVPFLTSFFFGGRGFSPKKMDYRKKSVPLFNLPTGGPR